MSARLSHRVSTSFTKQFLEFYSVEMPVNLLRPRAHSALILGLAALVVFTTAQSVGFVLQEETGVVNPPIAHLSIGINLFSIIMLCFFYLLNFKIAEKRKWDLALVYRISIYVVFTIFMFITLTHIWIAGSSSSIVPMMLVDLTLLNCWLAGYKQAWVYFFVGVLGWIGIHVLGSLRVIPFLPLHRENWRVPPEIFLEPRYLAINTILFVLFGGFIVYLVIYYQKQIQDQNLELDSKNRLLVQTNQQLQNLETLRDNLTQMIVHDLRSPLAGVTLNLQSVIRSLPPEGNDLMRHKLDRVYTGIVSQLELINSLLDVSRLEAGQFELHLEPVDLSQIIQQAVESLAGLAAERQVAAISREDLPWVVCDPGIIRRVLANLVGNALKFTDPADQVEIGVDLDEDSVKITVRDDGPGIPPEFHQKIFEKFGQAEIRGEKRMFSTGLGLAFCKLAIEAHHGAIGVLSTVGKGSTFWFTLPLQSQQTITSVREPSWSIKGSSSS